VIIITLLDGTKIYGPAKIQTDRPLPPPLPRTPSLPLPSRPALRRRPRKGRDGREKMPASKIAAVFKREYLRRPRIWAGRPAA